MLDAQVVEAGDLFKVKTQPHIKHQSMLANAALPHKQCQC
jgi:hypothetical protein